MLQRLTILSPGLLGASLGMAVRRQGLAAEIHVWARRAEARLACEESDWCDRVFEQPAEAAAGANLVVICAPVEFIPDLVKSIRDRLEAGTVVTDVGSTKSLICRLSQAALGSNGTFIGSHPMAGSEKSGMEHADAALFQDRACFVTPLEDTDENKVIEVCRFWRSLGMEMKTTSPESHDEIVAHISHLPHLLASALCCQLAPKKGWEAFAGGGLRDTTRVAAGSPALWKSIIEQNDAEVLRAIRGFELKLQEMQSAIQNKEWHRLRHLLERGQQYRENLG